MLSAETAAGRYPVETIEMMAAICVEAEQVRGQSSSTPTSSTGPSRRIDQSIAMAALFTAFHLGVKAIVALTESGSTALWMSRHKIARADLRHHAADQERSGAWRCYRNVTPMLMPNFADRDEALKHAEQLLVDAGVLKPGDTYGITCGEPMGYPGGTNMLKLARVG